LRGLAQQFKPSRFTDHSGRAVDRFVGQPPDFLAVSQFEILYFSWAIGTLYFLRFLASAMIEARTAVTGYSTGGISKTVTKRSTVSPGPSGWLQA